ncbi:MAG: cation:proton antiporter [Candidatus Aminicenantes bacterium]|jgi:CPA2 family monovalent cation:H+ antiporter-2
MILLKDIIIILFLAVILIVITAKLRFPPVIGFLLTGIIIGPSALGLVETLSEIEVLAEIGIILLMFTIGLEFSLAKIKEMKKNFLLFGGTQVFLGCTVFFFILRWYGLQFHQSLFGGFIITLSSTAIVLKLLQEQDRLNSPSGLKMTGILLFQDAALIPFLIILPSIFRFKEALSGQVFIKIALSILGVGIVFILSRILVPKIFSIILKVRIPELLMVSVFVFLFGTALVTYKLGASLAIGAFIAGIAISDSDYAHQVNTEIIPSRHIFNSIFFISIGMFINIKFLYAHLEKIILVTIIIIAIKTIIILFIFIISRHSLNEGFITALGLAHIGEFSFVLLKVSQQHNLFSPELYQLLLSAAVLSMFSIPFAMKLGRKISRYNIFKKKLSPAPEAPAMKNHAIIAGFGLNGRNIARVLKLLEIPYSILDINPVTVRKYKSHGEPIHYGDIDRADNLKTIGISRASLLIIAVSDMEACMRAIKLAKKLNPAITVIARSNFLSQVDKMYKLGADLVLSQDMETSLIFIQHILKFYQMPDHVVRFQTDLLRKEHYRFFIKEESREPWKIAMLDCIQQDNEIFFISPFSKHVSKKISELEPFNYEDMKIIGVIRRNKLLTRSLEELVIQKHDSIIFSGNHKKVYQALNWMEENN